VTIAVLLLELVLMLACLVAMTVGLVTFGRSVFTQLRQELRIPTTPADPELAAAAQKQIESLAARRGLPTPPVTAVPILGQPQPGARADMADTGGLGVTRFQHGWRRCRGTKQLSS
jgi:hypothetical protein